MKSKSISVMVDAIIVTPIDEYTMIREQMGKYYTCDIVSLENLLYNLASEEIG